uniref:Uncharacterized protein n=1 Tax=Clastoptera arizonana TaxID=38151 RepID=A0A1B6CVJ1_9HEMI
MDLLCWEKIGSGDSQIDNNKAKFDPVIFSEMRVLTNLLSVEKYYVPSCNYFSRVSTDVQPFMRKVVAGWMLEVCEEQKCEEQVFPMAVNLFDRFLCKFDVNRNHLQLIAAVCLLMVTKVRQCYALSIELLCFYADNCFTPDQMRKWELIVSTTVDWDITSVTGYDIVDHVLKRLRWSSEQPLVRTHALTLLSLCCREPDFMRVKPSMLASSCILAAARGLKVKAGTTESVLQLTGCHPNPVEEIISVIESLVTSQTMTLRVDTPPAPSTPSPKYNGTVEPAETPTDVQEVHF